MIAEKVHISELIGSRFDTSFVLYRHKILKYKYLVTPLFNYLEVKPQYGAGEAGVPRVDSATPRYIRITDIDENGFLSTDLGVTANTVEAKYILNNNDILIARSGNTVGKSYIHKTNIVHEKCFFAGYYAYSFFLSTRQSPFIVKSFWFLPIIFCGINFLLDIFVLDEKVDPWRIGRIVFGDYFVCFMAVLAFEQIFFTVVFLSIPTVLSLIYAVYLLTRKNKSSYSNSYVFRLRLEKIKDVSSIIFSFFIVALAVLVTLNAVLFAFFQKKDEMPAGNYSTYFFENIDSLEKFDEPEWEKLSFDEKLELLQKIADIEQCRLGIPNKMKVITDSVDKNEMGHYSDSDHTITIKTECMEKYGPWALIKTVCHEAYHGYEHRIIDLYFETSTEKRGLSIFDDAEKYYEEFKNYNDIDGDFYLYYNQLCEEDARKHGQEAVSEYYRWIKRYLRSK